MVQDPQRTKMVAPDGRKANREDENADPSRKVRIRALKALRYPTGERAQSGELVEKTYKPGDVLEVSAADAEAFCRPLEGPFLHRGEREGDDARRSTIVRAEMVRDAVPAATEGV